MSSPRTGHFSWTYQGETFKTWYKVYGDLKSFLAPVVVLHGGPGIPIYMEGHIPLFEKYGIPMIFYDQVGCGNSTRLKDKPAEFFRFELFMDELDALLAHFGIADGFTLLGHSWGGILGSEYAATRQPPGLRRLVLEDAPAALALWQSGMHKLLDRKPKEMKETILRHEADGTIDDPEYQKAIKEFQDVHVCKVHPWPKLLLDGVAAIAEDHTVVSHMLGPYEFNITGSLRDWSIAPKAHRILAPTLVINGVDDEAQDEAQMPFFKGIPKVRWVQFAASSHVPFFEEPDRYFSVVADFINSDV